MRRPLALVCLLSLAACELAACASAPAASARPLQGRIEGRVATTGAERGATSKAGDEPTELQSGARYRVSFGLFTSAFPSRYSDPTVRDALDPLLPSLQRCADEDPGPLLEGYVHVLVTVSPDGRVASLADDVDDVQSASFLACVHGALEGLRLPEHTGPDPVRVRVPLRVQRAGTR